MKFTVYEGYDDEHAFDDYDSEDDEYPVLPLIAPGLALEAYNLETQAVVDDALSAKSEEIQRIKMLARESSLRFDRQMIAAQDSDLKSLHKSLDSLRLRDREADDNLNRDFERSNATLLETVELAIAKALKQEEAEAARQLAARQQEEAARAESKRLEQEKVERDLAIKAQEKQAEADRVRLLESKAEAEKAEQSRKAALGGTPEEDAIMWKRCLETFKLDVLKPVSEAMVLKNFCARARLRLNPKVGQVTKSVDQIKQVSAAIVAILEEAKTKDTEGLALRWCLNFLAKALARQAEREVMVKPAAAYPLAFLAVSIMSRFPDFATVYECRIFKKCPWALPYVAYDKDLESGRKALGFKRHADGSYESATVYLERQCGLFMLWAGTVSLNAAPMPISRGWKWMARLINSIIKDNELRDVAFAMISSFLEIAGKPLAKTYGPQAAKLCRAASLWIGEDTRGANASRLRILLEEYISHGVIGSDFQFEQ